MSSQTTPPSPDPSPGPAAADPSESSSTGSPGLSFVADPGPGFNPDAAGGPAPEQPSVDERAAAAPGWTEAQIRQLLAVKGQLLHTAIAVGPKVDVDTAEWIYLEEDLDAIAPPLARMMNRIPAVKAASAGADPFAVALGFAGYGIRSVQEASAARAIAADRAAGHQAVVELRPQPDGYAPPAPAPPAEAAHAEVRDMPPLQARR